MPLPVPEPLHMTDKPKPTLADIPALFATIYFRSDERPDGYTDEDIAELNEAANAEPAPPKTEDDGPA